MGAIVDRFKDKRYEVVVIGSGFGASVAITKLAEAGKKVLVLERGTWWGNPEGPAIKTGSSPPPEKIFGSRQWWPRPNDSQGLVYMMHSIYKQMDPVVDLIRPFVKDNDLGLRKNRKGLYRLSRFTHRHGNVDVVSGNGVGRKFRDRLLI